MRRLQNSSPVFSTARQAVSQQSRRFGRLWPVACAVVCGAAVSAASAAAQVSVLTEHNDIARTGQNTQETILTPANVNPTQFGKLFSHVVAGETFAQPLYVPQVKIAKNKGTHNVVYVATYEDYVYAFDADSNGGIAAAPLWQVDLLTNSTPAGVTYASNSGVQGTPVIDPATNTMYLVSSESQNGVDLYRLHALDITSGGEKFGGPVQVAGSVPGTGSGSVGGVLAFDAQYHYQRPGLLLLNGVVYFAFGSVNDNGPWHGWLFSYSAATLKQLGVFCTSATGTAGGIWMGGAGLAAEVNDPSKPYGRMFLATGNGSYAIGAPTKSGQPYSGAANQYSMSVLDLDLTNGVPTVQDEFTPYDEALLDSQDGDLGSGGPILLPAQTLASGKTLNPLIQIGKSGMMYILDRDDNAAATTAYQPAGLGGFNASADHVVQEVQTPETGAQGWGAGVWGTEAYWNNTIYYGGTNPGASNALAAYSFVNGALSKLPTSVSNEQFSYQAPTPSVSANGATNGIVWVLDTHAYVGGGAEVLYAYDATNLANLLYSSNAEVARDAPGAATREAVVTIANGKAYVPAAYQFSVYGILGTVPTAPAPVIGPTAGTFSGSQQITITDAVAGATIYYTLDGSTPTSSSAVYAGPFKIYSSETVTAVASPTGYLQSAPSSAVYSSTSNAANPVFSLAAGSYSGAQRLTITDATKGAAIHYTVDGTTPTSASAVYAGPISVPVSETVQAVATAPSLLASTVVAAAYTINPVYTLNFSQGFAQAQSSGQMKFNGSTDLDDFRLQLTNGGTFEAGSAFFATQVNIQEFTTNFTFQLSNPVGDGFTFTIQGDGPTALGGYGSGLGYATIPKSVAIKFDLYSNQGEGPNSTGLYIDGAVPTIPAVSLVGSPVDLHSGDYINAQITYDSIDLTLTLTNPISGGSWSYSWPIDIPATVGGSTAYVGFTGGTGKYASSQKLTSWTYVAGMPALPNFPAGFDGIGLYSQGVGVSGGALELTNGAGETNAAFYGSPVDIEAFSTNFNFTINGNAADTLADGFALVIQNSGPHALGSSGGGLGYAGIPNSVALKFDVFNNSGEGSDSTGVYVNGAPPTVPSIDLTSYKVLIGSGDTINAQVTYDGTTLAWRLQDLSTPNPRVYQGEKTINIPHTIGGNTAYIGFTASSGDGYAIQKILDWTFSSTP